MRRTAYATLLVASTVLVVSSLSPTTALGQDHVMTIGDATGEPGATISLNVDYDNNTSDQAIAGWSFGVSHDGAQVTLQGAVDGASVTALNDGAGPDFSQVNLLEEGWTTGVVISFFGSDTLAPGASHEMNVASYVLSGLAAGGSSEICFTDQLGTPPVSSILVVGTDSVDPVLVCGTISAGASAPLAAFQAGDCNQDSMFDMADGIFLIGFFFVGGPESSCPASCDTDANGNLEIDDAIATFNFLFAGGPPPVGPFPDCGNRDGVTIDNCAAANCP